MSCRSGAGIGGRTQKGRRAVAVRGYEAGQQVIPSVTIGRRIVDAANARDGKGEKWRKCSGAVAAIDGKRKGDWARCAGGMAEKKGRVGCRLKWGALSGQNLAGLRGSCSSAVRLVWADTF